MQHAPPLRAGAVDLRSAVERRSQTRQGPADDREGRTAEEMRADDARAKRILRVEPEWPEAALCAGALSVGARSGGMHGRCVEMRSGRSARGMRTRRRSRHITCRGILWRSSAERAPRRSATEGVGEPGEDRTSADMRPREAGSACVLLPGKLALSWPRRDRPPARRLPEHRTSRSAEPDP